MKIFKTPQTSIPSGCNGMTQYVNETDRPIQVNFTGDYIGPGEAVIAIENMHIEIAARNGFLAVYDFSSSEKEVAQNDAKSGKKYKKAETAAETAESELIEAVATEETKQEDSVVAIETTDI
jgi:hypothetical protein